MNIGRAAKRGGPIVIGLVLVGFGLGCVNYTKPGTIQYHQQWATTNGRPAPSDAVLWGGAGSAVFGAFAVGFGVARLIGGRGV